MDEPRQLARPKEPLLLHPPAGVDLATKAPPPSEAPTPAATEPVVQGHPLGGLHEESKKPDYGLFATNVGNAAAVFFAIILFCEVEMNYFVVAVLFLVIIAFSTWSFWNHGAPHRSVAFRWIGVIAQVVILGLLGTYGTVKRYRTEHSPKPISEAENKLLKIFADLKDNQEQQDSKVFSLLTATLNNPKTSPSQSISILEAQQEKLSENQKALNRAKKVISEAPISIQSIRLELANKQAMDENLRQQAEIQKKRKEIESNVANEMAEIKMKNDEEAKRKEDLKADQHLMDQCLEVFDYTVQQLHQVLTGLARDTGDTITFDLPNPPTVSKSAIVVEGKMIDGTNFIRLGTNSEWDFKIIVVADYYIHYETSGFPRGIFYPPKLSIVNSMNSWESILSVQPLAAPPNRNDRAPRYNEPNNYDSITISMSITNRVISAHNMPIADYKSGIDEVLHSLIQLQDAQFPLPIRSKTP